MGPPVKSRWSLVSKEQRFVGQVVTGMVLCNYWLFNSRLLYFIETVNM